MLSFAAPLFLWTLGLLPVIVVLHFIRARRVRRRVAALFLWRRAQQAAQRQRRFAPTWLLLAQLLFVGLASLALARPQWGGGAAPDRIIVIDASASMAARDAQGDRFGRAKAVAGELLSGAGRVAIVRAGLDARVVAPLTSDRSVLRGAIAALEPGDRTADLDRALNLAAAIEPGAEVNLITDRPPPGGSVRYHGVAADGLNVGISAFELGIQQAYIGIVSNSAGPVQVALSLTSDGSPVASGEVLVPAGGVGSMTFPLDDVAGIYQARITPPDGDALALDDVAYAGSRVIQAVLDTPNEALVKALGALPGVSLRTTALAATVQADLHVLVRTSSEGLEPGAYIVFAPAAAEPEFETIRGWDRADPLLRFVDLGDVVVGLDAGRVPWQDGEGWRVLATTGDLEPVLRVKDEGGSLILQAAFHPDQSDLVLRAAFPALMANFVRKVRGDAQLELGQALPAGAVFRAVGTSGSSEGQGTPERWALKPGIYEVGQTTYLASLLSASESRLPVPVAGAAGTDVPAAPRAGAASAATGSSFRAFGLVLVGLALAALVAEWLLWSGVGGPRRRPPLLRRRG